jgi:hypothetical protein
MKEVRTMHPTQVPEGDPRAARSQPTIRLCREDESETMLAIINSAAEAYRGAIPADCWHEPYMPTANTPSQTGIAFQTDDGRTRGFVRLGCAFPQVLFINSSGTCSGRGRHSALQLFCGCCGRFVFEQRARTVGHHP